MKIINYANYIKIGDRYYPPNSYILSTVDDNLVVITTLDNNINVTLAWTQFTDVNDDPYATLEDVITALLANISFPPVVPADTITGSLTSGILPKASGANTIANSQVKDNGVTVYMGAAPTSAKALFDLISTTKGFFMPRMTTAQQAAIGAGATDVGLMLFNLTLLRPTFYDHVTTSFKKLLITEDVGNITLGSIVIDSSHTGDMLETVLDDMLIPANTMAVGDQIYINYMGRKGNGFTGTLRGLFSTTPDLTGTLTRIFTQTIGAGIRSLDSDRSFFIKPGPLFQGLNRSSSTNNTFIGTNTETSEQRNSTVIDITVNQYFLLTVQLDNNSEIYTSEGLIITRDRA